MKKAAFIILLFLAACNPAGRHDPDDPVLARAYDHYLRASQLSGAVPKDVSANDSAVFVQNYIQKWIQQQVFLHEARTNLTASEQDFDRQLEEYRRTLMLYAFETKLVRIYLDTNVTDQEIEKYYRDNRPRFELKGNIVKFDFIKLPVGSRKLSEFRRMLQSGRPENVSRLEDYCRKYSTDYWLSADWVFFNDLLNELPFTPDNQEHFLRRTKYSETKDEQYYYLLRINDFKTVDSIPPLSLERGNIRNIIINARKIKILEEKKKEITDKAIRSKDVEIFSGAE